jgi:hypothetical protein
MSGSGVLSAILANGCRKPISWTLEICYLAVHD